MSRTGITPPPDAIDLPLIESLMRALEAGVHRGGWTGDNGHMQLFVLHETATTGPTYARTFRPIVRQGPYTVGRMLSPAAFDCTGLAPPDTLRNIAMYMAYDTGIPEVAEMRDRISVPGVIAFLCVFEAWAASVTLAEMEADPTAYVGDLPGAETARLVMCVDAWDRAHTLNRRKGYKPVAALDGPMRGDVSTSLRILMDMAYRRTPPLARFDDHYPSLIDTARRLVKTHRDGTDLPPDPFRDPRGYRE